MALRVSRRRCGSIASAWHRGDKSGTVTMVATIQVPLGAPAGTMMIGGETAGTNEVQLPESIHCDDLRDASHESKAPFSLELCLTTGRIFLQCSNAAFVLLK